MTRGQKICAALLVISITAALCSLPALATKLTIKWQPYHEYGSDDVNYLSLYIQEPYNLLIADTLSIYDSTYSFEVAEGYNYVFCLLATDTANNESECAIDSLDLTKPVMPAGFGVFRE